LEETRGTIVFQEQVIEVAMALSGFSSSEAEELRRAGAGIARRRRLMLTHERLISGARRASTEIREQAVAQLRTVAPTGHSFDRRAVDNQPGATAAI